MNHKAHQDQKYIEALVVNNHQLVEEIYQNHAGDIMSLVVKNSGTVNDAKDVFQEALLSLHKQALGGFVLTCPLNAYLKVVCRNIWLNKLKRYKREVVTNWDVEVYEGIADDYEVFAKQEAEDRLIEQNFVKMGGACQKLLRLSWTIKADTNKYYKLKDIAEELGQSYGYVRKKIGECRKKIIALVKEDLGRDEL